jgi:hypothetical protein
LSIVAAKNAFQLRVSSSDNDKSSFKSFNSVWISGGNFSELEVIMKIRYCYVQDEMIENGIKILSLYIIQSSS